MRIQPRSWTFRKIDSAEAKRPGCRIFLIHADAARSEEHTSELQSQSNLVCRLLLEKKHVAILRFIEDIFLLPGSLLGSGLIQVIILGSYRCIYSLQSFTLS